MIYGIGVDMVEVKRIEDGIERFGSRLAKKILTEKELQYYDHNIKPVKYLAKRFAAKEALVKALGTGFRGQISLRDICVTNDDLGKPELEYSESLQQKLKEYDIIRTHLSITDENEYALAYVILESA